MIDLGSDFNRFLVFLSMFDNTYSKNQQLIDLMEDDFSFKHFFSLDLKKVLNEKVAENMKAWANEQTVENYYADLKNKDIILLTKFDSEYPRKLSTLPDAPMFLFCKGDIGLFDKESLAVVGTRKPTNYGRVATEKIVKDIASAGVVIVSGLAYGVDSISHRACLSAGGKTIAVLGSGFDRIYPAEHISLAREIAEKGLLVSEYSPTKKATTYTFPVRNRIIAGLSDGILITEAGIKSGTIHTKDYALDYGRNIYALPGNIDSPSSELPNKIIKSGQAICVTEAKDILDIYKVEAETAKKEYQLTFEEQAIVSLLGDGMKNIDYLTKNCNLSINNFNSNLTMLEIRGIITRLPGGFISLN